MTNNEWLQRIKQARAERKAHEELWVAALIHALGSNDV